MNILPIFGFLHGSDIFCLKCSYILTFCVLFSISEIGQGKSCIQDGLCKCTFDDGSGTVDLTPLGRTDGIPMYVQTHSIFNIPFNIQFNSIFHSIFHSKFNLIFNLIFNSIFNSIFHSIFNSIFNSI